MHECTFIRGLTHRPAQVCPSLLLFWTWLYIRATLHMFNYMHVVFLLVIKLWLNLPCWYVCICVLSGTFKQLLVHIMTLRVQISTRRQCLLWKMWRLERGNLFLLTHSSQKHGGYRTQVWGFFVLFWLKRLNDPNLHQCCYLHACTEITHLP